MEYPLLNDKIDSSIIVSDLHCTNECKPLCRILEISQKNSVGTIIIIGDLFDDMHFNVSCKVVIARIKKYLSKCIENLPVNIEIIYVTSRASHDPILQNNCVEKIKINGKQVYLKFFNSPIIAKIDKYKVFLTHGEIIVKNGAIAFLVNNIMRRLGMELFLEKMLRKKLGLDDETFLVMGHTHIEGIDLRHLVANTGSWKEKWRGKISYWRKPRKSFILIKDGTLKLLFANEVL